jgi:hypothetical protein
MSKESKEKLDGIKSKPLAPWVKVVDQVLAYIHYLESRIVEGSDGHWTRDLVPEDGVYFYTTRHDDGSWTEPEKVYLVCDEKWAKKLKCSQLPENQRRWSKKVPEWIPPLPKEDE